MSDVPDSDVPDDAQPRGADVRVVPPLLFAVPFALGLLAHRAWPLRVPGRPGSAWAGGALTACGLALSVSGAATVTAQHTTIVPHHPVTTMVTSGPYRVSRNPMYTGLALTHAGGALAVGSFWPLLALPAAILAVRRLVVDAEESYLHHRFGAGYDTYAARVRRWL